jgi:8-oxo-dGTP pyrophosphatase MutT (NUDIX family)
MVALADMNQVYGSVFLSPRNRILLVKGRKTGIWSFPKGHPKQGETAFQCAKRETYEETGLELPPFFERILILAKGSYFVVSSPEYECQIRDKKEVSEVEWVDLKDAENYHINVDVSSFLKRQKQRQTCSPIQSKPTIVNVSIRC